MVSTHSSHRYSKGDDVTFSFFSLFTLDDNNNNKSSNDNAMIHDTGIITTNKRRMNNHWTNQREEPLQIQMKMQRVERESRSRREITSRNNKHNKMTFVILTFCFLSVSGFSVSAATGSSSSSPTTTGTSSSSSTSCSFATTSQPDIARRRKPSSSSSRLHVSPTYNGLDFLSSSTGLDCSSTSSTSPSPSTSSSKYNSSCDERSRISRGIRSKTRDAVSKLFPPPIPSSSSMSSSSTSSSITTTTSATSTSTATTSTSPSTMTVPKIIKTDKEVDIDANEYERRKREWAERYTNVESLRKLFGENRNKLWGDLDAATTRRLYKTLLPRALLEMLSVGVTPHDLAPLAYQARVAAKLYARERCVLPARCMATAYDGWRQFARYGKFQPAGMTYPQVWDKYEQAILEELHHQHHHEDGDHVSDHHDDMHDLTEEDVTAKICLKILEKSCATNELIDRWVLPNQQQQGEQPGSKKQSLFSKQTAAATSSSHDDLKTVIQQLEKDVHDLLNQQKRDYKASQIKTLRLLVKVKRRLDKLQHHHHHHGHHHQEHLQSPPSTSRTETKRTSTTTTSRSTTKPSK